MPQNLSGDSSQIPQLTIESTDITSSTAMPASVSTVPSNVNLVSTVAPIATADTLQPPPNALTEECLSAVKTPPLPGGPTPASVLPQQTADTLVPDMIHVDPMAPAAPAYGTPLVDAPVSVINNSSVVVTGIT